MVGLAMTKISKKQVKNITVDICHRARCNGNHDKLIFKPLTRNQDDLGFSHWASCPYLGEPVLLKILGK